MLRSGFFLSGGWHVSHTSRVGNRLSADFVDDGARSWQKSHAIFLARCFLWLKVSGSCCAGKITSDGAAKLARVTTSASIIVAPLAHCAAARQVGSLHSPP